MPSQTLRPSEIHFVHDTINCRFQDGRHLLDTFRELLHGNISPHDIQVIAVIRQNGTWYVHAGNRRLFLYKKLEELGIIGDIPVWVVNRPNADAVRERHTTQNRGVSVSVRNDHAFEYKMHSIIDEWRRTRNGGLVVQAGLRHMRSYHMRRTGRVMRYSDGPRGAIFPVLAVMIGLVAVLVLSTVLDWLQLI